MPCMENHRLMNYRSFQAWIGLCVVVFSMGLVVGPVFAADHPPVSFSAHIRPILMDRCASCHVGDNRKGGFSLDSREVFLEGGESGPAAVAGSAGESLVMRLVTSNDPDERMPAKGDALTEEQIALLRLWIDQGLVWDEAIESGEARWQPPLAPRAVAIPTASAAEGLTNPIDRILGPWLAERGQDFGEPISDRLFARRVYLDLVGLVPSVAQLEAFVADRRVDKRAQLVEALLADRKDYTEHWLTFWNDALRNAYRGTGFIDGGREQITQWLYQSLYDNKPYDQFVRELVNPVEGSRGFSKGIVWRGVVNASQIPPMQAAQNIGQVFMGINLKCASCHDSFINQWKLTDAYGMAAVYAQDPLEINRCDKPTGRLASPAFIYPELGSISTDAPLETRISELAAILTSADNGRLARTMVNRLWARFFGIGLVEPVDEMDHQPWQEDLLDFLAWDFQEHGYDLKRTMRLICTSRAYEMAAVGAPKPDASGYTFGGPIVRRMTAEQFYDAVSILTDDWPERYDAPLPEGASASLGSVNAKARWIWSHPGAAKADPGGRIFLRKTVTLDHLPAQAVGVVTCDNEFTLYVNGEKVAASADWQKPVTVDLTGYLRQGRNVIAVEAINWPDVETGKGLASKGANPGGFVFFAAAYDEDGKVGAALGSDKTWLVRKGEQADWLDIECDESEWRAASELEAWNGDSIKMGGALAMAIDRSLAASGGVRAAMINDDALMRAMGRPNREQVVTRRDSIATTLQALELTNGAILYERLSAGADWWLSKNLSVERLIEDVYKTALGRLPTAEEREVAMSMVGAEATRNGVADLLWAITMLPDFQLIH